DDIPILKDFVEPQGHDKVFVTGHNGHIEKTSAAFGYKSMGDYLDETFGDSYFAIGTESARSTFLADNGDGERETFTVKNNSSLTKACGNVDADRFYVDFEQAETNEELDDIISSKQKMTNIGDDFRSWYKISKFFYTNKMVPNEAYDGLIIVDEATPTEIIEN